MPDEEHSCTRQPHLSTLLLVIMDHYIEHAEFDISLAAKLYTTDIWPPKTRLASVQSVLKAAVRMIARLPPYSRICDYMINELHRFPVLARVRYNVLLLVAKSLQGLAPKYLCELMSKPLSARSSRPLRSANRCDLLISSAFLRSLKTFIFTSLSR